MGGHAHRGRLGARLGGSFGGLVWGARLGDSFGGLVSFGGLAPPQLVWGFGARWGLVWDSVRFARSPRGPF